MSKEDRACPCCDCRVVSYSLARMMATIECTACGRQAECPAQYYPSRDGAFLELHIFPSGSCDFIVTELRMKI